jgi:taurine--2-oxoglutarate transaminase
MSDEVSVRADDRAYVFHSWSAQGLIDPLPVAGAEGSYFWDYAGKRYLDFSSQLVNVNIGHQHPRLVEAIQEQAAKLCTIAPSFANDKRGEAARLIAELAPGTLNKVFFTNAGAEANENAIRLARLHTGRHKVLSTYRSYHGATATAITATGDPRRWPNEPIAIGVVHFWGPYPYRHLPPATSGGHNVPGAPATPSFEGPRPSPRSARPSWAPTDPGAAARPRRRAGDLR